MFNGSILLPVNFVFFIPRSETLLIFVKFWLYQAFLRVYCLALSELGDFHKSVLD